MVRGPAAQHPPEALNDIALRTITRPPFHPQLWIGRAHGRHQGPTMPGRLINRADNLGLLPGRRDAGDIPQGRRKRPWQALLLARTRLRFAARRLLQPVRRHLPRHHMERRKTIDEVLGIPRTDGGAMALHPQGGPACRHQRKAGCVLAQQPALLRLGFFFTRPARPALPAASGGRPAGSERSAGTAGSRSAGRRRASRCAGPGAPGMVRPARPWC